MGLDEFLFGRVQRWFTRRREAAVAATRFDLVASEPRLSRLLWILAGEPVRLVFGAERAVLGERLALPEWLEITTNAADAADVAMLRLVLAAEAWRQGVHGPADAALPVRAAAVRCALPVLLEQSSSAWPSALRLRESAERHCALLAAHRTGADAADLAVLATYGDLPAAPRADARAVRDDEPVTDDALPRGTERERRVRRVVRTVELAKDDDGQNPLAHVFEKVKTAEEHTGGNRSLDGSDELDAHLEALEELDLAHVLRTRQRAASVFRADLDGAELVPLEGSSEQTSSSALRYDEWDDRGRRYLADWCSVFATTIAEPEPAESVAATIRTLRGRHTREIRALRAEFGRLLGTRRLRRRQRVGTDVDMDALVERHGAVRAMRTGDCALGEGLVYVARRTAVQDVATLILIDHSLSSDSWIAGRRVLDVARESVVVLGEVLRDIALPVAVAGFCSHSRRDCRFGMVKGFRESWDVAQRRLFGLRPDGYTRIGPALRHATELLCATKAHKRLLLVLSDCKPTDYDHYEGRHGIGDVRQALRTAKARGVQGLALTIDTRASAHLPRMFGPHGFRVLPSPAALPLALARLHEQVLG